MGNFFVGAELRVRPKRGHTQVPPDNMAAI